MCRTSARRTCLASVFGVTLASSSLASEPARSGNVDFTFGFNPVAAGVCMTDIHGDMGDHIRITSVQVGVPSATQVRINYTPVVPIFGASQFWRFCCWAMG